MNKAIFFDRDGVLNKSVVKDGCPFPPSSLSELILTDSIEETCHCLRSLGYILIIITNQPDVARGKTSVEAVGEINEFLKKKLNLDSIYCCFHDDHDRCDCRKPLPGMLVQAQKKYDLDFESSYVIGDRWKDIQAGFIVGCKTIFIDYDYAEKKIPSDFVIYSTKEIINIFGDLK